VVHVAHAWIQAECAWRRFDDPSKRGVMGRQAEGGADENFIQYRSKDWLGLARFGY